MVGSVAIVGGTGALGRGLAGRFLQAGLEVVIGSRDPDRARSAATATAEKVAQLSHDVAGGTLEGGSNVDVLDRDLVIVSLPVGALEATAPQLATGLRGRVVVSTMNPLGFDDDGPYPMRLPGGSAAVTLASHLPDARVTAAFHTVSSHHLLRFDEPMDDDVPVVGDDRDAVDAVLSLIDRVPGFRGLDAGPLRLAAPLEDLTPVLIAINKRARRHVGVRFSRLPDRG